MRTRINNVLLTVSLLLTFAAQAQQSTADSLKRILGFSNDTTRVSLLLRLSEAYLKFSPKKAIDPANEAKVLSVQLGNDTLEAKSLLVLGKVYYKAGNFNEAINRFELSRKIYLQLGMEEDADNILISMADAYQDKGDYDKALKKSFDAYKAFEAKGNKKGMASALIVSGTVYRIMKNYDKAIIDYEQALSISKAGGDASLEASCLNNLSNVYSDKKDYEKTIGFLERAKVIYQRLDDKFALSKVLNNLGVVYYLKKDYDKASDYFLQSLDIRKQIGDKRGMAATLDNLGSVSLDQDKPEKAIDYFNRALEISKNISASEIQLDVLSLLSESYSRMGDNAKALQFYKDYSTLKDSVFSENLSKSIAEMQAQYGVEKAESETRAQQKEKKLITIASAVGGILLIVVVFFLWNRAVTRKRVNERLNEQKQEIEKKNSELHEANVEIELKNKDITDSIQYASRIQEAILPEVEFTTTFGDSGFVLYRPKDIVSGDFYWMAQTEEYLWFAAVDCTGHGVPGAFISIVCSNLLSQSVKEYKLVRPDDILNDVNVRLSETLRQRQDESRVRDGMDIALCCLHKKTRLLQFAGAFNPAWIFKESELTELLPDKFPIGLFEEEELRKFSSKEIQLEKGNRIYVFTDGYSDQFGGQLGKKYKRSVFCDFVKKIQPHPMKEQCRLLEEEHVSWKGTVNDQVDDILVLGIEIG